MTRPGSTQSNASGEELPEKQEPLRTPRSQLKSGSVLVPSMPRQSLWACPRRGQKRILEAEEAMPNRLSHQGRRRKVCRGAETTQPDSGLPRVRVSGYPLPSLTTPGVEGNPGSERCGEASIFHASGGAKRSLSEARIPFERPVGRRCAPDTGRATTPGVVGVARSAAPTVRVQRPAPAAGGGPLERGVRPSHEEPSQVHAALLFGDKIASVRDLKRVICVSGVRKEGQHDIEAGVS